jgi:hypothetical protein
MKRKIALWLGMSLLLIGLASCGGTAEPQIVEVTRVVTETEVVEVETVTETVVEVEVEVTREVEVVVTEVMVEDGSLAAGATESGEGGSPHTPTDGPKATNGTGWVDESAAPGAGSAESEAVRGEGGTADDGAVAEEMVESAAMPAPLGTSPAPPSSGTAEEALPINTELTAGNIDDNAQWDSYMTYLRQYSGPAILPVDVSERHQITVLDSTEFPVLGATLRVVANGEVVQTLRTTSDGRAYFFPRALPANQQIDEYVIRAEVGGQTTELLLASGGANNIWVINHPVGNEETAVTRLDIHFLIDTTGSMADEIYQLTANVQSIARRINALEQDVEVRYGMTVYRDRGDEYTTRTFEFTPDINFFEEGLRQVSAAGGGDYPEDLNEGLFKAIHVPEWRVEETISLIFLIADAPPQLVYEDQETNYSLEMVEAAERGIKIYPIASSVTDAQAEYVFRQLAQYTGGKFLFLTYGAGGAGTTGTETDMTVEEGSYDVTSLDGMVIQMVEEELAHRQR